MWYVCRAKKDLDEHVMVTDKWEELCSGLDQKMIIMAPFCGEIPCEDLIKKKSARSVGNHVQAYVDLPVPTGPN